MMMMIPINFVIACLDPFLRVAILLFVRLTSQIDFKSRFNWPAKLTCSWRGTLRGSEHRSIAKKIRQIS